MNESDKAWLWLIGTVAVVSIALGLLLAGFDRTAHAIGVVVLVILFVFGALYALSLLDPNQRHEIRQWLKRTKKR